MNIVAIQKVIGSNLQKARKAKRYTQEEVARAADLTTNYYATLERGEAIGSVETIYRLSEVLKVKPSDIFPDRT